MQKYAKKNMQKKKYTRTSTVLYSSFLLTFF